MNKTTQYNYFGEQICRLRKSKGWTQKNLGEKLGKKVSTISAYETNAKLPSAECLITMADLFDVSIDTLVRGNSAERLSVKALTAEQREVIALIIQELSSNIDAHKHSDFRLQLAVRILELLAE